MAVLTVNERDPTRDYVRSWLAERGYDFPVLWGDGYGRKAKVRGYPTTWVVDKDGTVAFTVIGGGERFAQEFGWRVEALLEN